ncbi:RING finger domain-containing protein, partial [Endozoicomonas sp. ALC013]
MDSIPSSPAEAIPTENAICPICHDDLYRPEDPEFAGRHVTIARPCGHKFHLNCLTTWTDDHLTCPVGRRVIETVELEILTLPPDWRQQMITA